MGTLLAAIGDIHGRFDRVDAWLANLERAHGRLDGVLALGDLETFAQADAPLRKKSKQVEPAEFGPYARGERRLRWPLYFIGGNNEDFAPLDAIREGGRLAENVHFLGRAGARELFGLRVAFLSGIYAPKQYEAALEAPSSPELAKRWGYFRAPEVARLRAEARPELLLLHDWPRGLVTRRPAGAPKPASPPPRPWLGNAIGREVADALRPSWILCGHNHQAWAGTLPSGTRVACLDEADKPEAGVLWLEVEDGRITKLGWGLGTRPAWQSGQAWDASQAP